MRRNKIIEGIANGEITGKEKDLWYEIPWMESAVKNFIKSLTVKTPKAIQRKTSKRRSI